MPNQAINEPARADNGKRCRVCAQVKPTSDFYRSPGDAHQLRNACKACCRAESRAGLARRQRALTRLIAAHREEYRRLLAAERRAPSAFSVPHPIPA